MKKASWKKKKKTQKKGKNLTSFCQFNKIKKIEISHLFKTKVIFQKMEDTTLISS
jgi:hypothetical protein